MSIFDVLKNPITASVGGKTPSPTPVPTQSTSVRSPYAPELFKPSIVPSSSLPKINVTGLAKSAGHAALDIVRTPIRSIVSATSLLGGNPDATITPKTTAEKAIFGEEPIPSYAAKTREKEQSLIANGHSPTFARILAAPAIAAGTVLDVFAEGGEEKKIAEALSRETSETGIRKLLSEGTKLPAEVSDRITPQLAKATTKEEVQGILDSTKVAPAPDLETHLSDMQKIQKEPINTSHLNISPEGKQLVNKTVEEIKPMLESKVGKRLSNQEALDLADRSSKILTRSVDRETTKAYEAALIRLRQDVAHAAQTGTVDKEFIDNLLTLKSAGADAGRKLQSFSIGVDPKDYTAKQAIVEAVLGTTKDIDEIVKAAEGVDFTNLEQATNFYRQFVKPKASEWIDLVRYNSMLSSPITHLVNIFGNLTNTVMVAPIEKAIAGGLDFLGSALTGKERKYFAGEAGSHLAHYFDNVKEATNRFSEVMKGTRVYTNLDTRSLPVATSGLKGKVASALSAPMKLLEGMDQFFTALTEGAERGSLQYRASKGVNVGNIESQAEEATKYRLFRQRPGDESQGHVLDAIDQVTKKLQEFRNNKNPLVSTAAKWTVPFLQTPMNIFKQGLEYSPAGFATIPGALNKTEQLSKAVMGSAVAATAATLIGSNRMTWSEPTDPTTKAAFRAAGMQPYSIKVGNKWVSYQKLPPAIAFPMAMVASVDDLVKNKKMDQSTGELILGGVAKYGSFLADQSYVKSLGDLLSAAQGDTTAVSQLVGNYPQQLIPYRALDGWMARLVDNTQRQIDNKAGFIDKQMQLLMTNIPILSKQVPPRLDTEGNPIENSNRFLNAFSPVKISTEDEAKAKRFDDILTLKKLNSEEAIQSKDVKTQADALNEELKAMSKTEAFKKEMQTKRDNPTLYDRLKSVQKTDILGLNKEDTALKALTVINRAKFIQDKLSSMSIKEQATYKSELKKKKILTSDVQKELTKLRFKKT